MVRSSFLSYKSVVLPGMAAVALALSAVQVNAQTVSGSTQTTTDAQGQPQQNMTISVDTSKKKAKKEKVAKEDRVKQTKDTKVAMRKEKKYNPLIGKDADLPDKQLYDKALAQAKSGHFDVARLDLQTLLNTYPDSQYQMRAKLAVADTWYKEGGSAALAQAEQEYKDFITFFPNAPESAEAQMRVGDIYFKQMDVPDRDYTKAIHAQEEYRNMLKQYPDAPKTVIAEAQQKLRDVHEVLAQREADLAAFYATHENWAAAIARWQTVADNYPLYSHMDDVLIGIGDAYAAQARVIRSQQLPEGPKATLEQEYDGKAAAAYRKVVLEHSAALHVEDAKERLAGMNLPVPTPTPEQAAASEALEGSRARYNLQRRLELVFLHRPNTVLAAQMGEAPLEDKPVTTAPSILNQFRDDYKVAFDPTAKVTAAVPAPTPTESSPATAITGPATSAAPLAFQDVPAAGSGNGDGSVGSVSSAPSTSGGRAPGASLGVEVLTPGVVNTGSGAASDRPSAVGAQDPNYGLRKVTNNSLTALPPEEKPAEAPDQVNDAAGKSTPAAETKQPGKKKTPKPEYDDKDESSSKHKPKKAAGKLNPF